MPILRTGRCRPGILCRLIVRQRRFPGPFLRQRPRRRSPGRRSGLIPDEFRPTILGVTEVTHVVRDAVRADERLRDVWVEGEVGRVTISSAGHAYFTLKDERSQLSCIWFRDDRLASPFEPRTGLRVVAHGRIDVFDQQGVYQLYVSAVQPAGFGDLALRFEELKARLAAEGLFEAARKRPLPPRPAVIAVATSASGAVWHDIRHVLERRWPLAEVVFAACQVQGEPAPASIVAALARIARYADQCIADGRPANAPVVTILARGGGSLEDLWSFNDERVVRAIVGHPLPLVCGVGHETDVTLADFAADVRAPTPSAAAEIVVPDRVQVAAGLAADARRLTGVAQRQRAPRGASSTPSAGRSTAPAGRAAGPGARACRRPARPGDQDGARPVGPGPRGGAAGRGAPATGRGNPAWGGPRQPGRGCRGAGGSGAAGHPRSGLRDRTAVRRRPDPAPGGRSPGGRRVDDPAGRRRARGDINWPPGTRMIEDLGFLVWWW